MFQNLFLSHEDTERTVNSGQMDFICFTGSVPAGQRIGQTAAGTFAGVALELGGKDPAYVVEDANFDDAVENLVDGAFSNSGQSCCGIERIYVYKTLFDTFVEAYVERVKQYSLTYPLQPGTILGPAVKTSAADWVRKQVSEAVSEGASAWIDPALFPAAAENTTYLASQVLTHVNHNMSMMTGELWAGGWHHASDK